jgi:hypothetical protein
LPLAVGDAVFGPAATAEAIVDVGPPADEARLHLTARLAPLSRRAAEPGLAVVRYRGTLTVRAEDDRGRFWQRDFLASGEIGVEGELAVAPAGFDIPGNSCPSPECDARSGVVPGDGPGVGIGVRVEPSVYDDRRP